MQKIFEAFIIDSNDFVKVHHFAAFGQYRVRSYTWGKWYDGCKEKDRFYHTRSAAIADAIERTFKPGEVYSIVAKQF